MRILLKASCLLAVLLVAGCAYETTRPEMAEVGGQTPTHPVVETPATFSGTLPCADCPGIDVQLDLLADGAYFLRETYQDRDNGSFDDIGRYLFSSHHDQISLHGGREAPRRFALSSKDTLTMLDQEGRAIDSELNYSLTRQPEFQPISPRGQMTGMYRHMVGAGRFRECHSGLEMPVATEADNRALEKAYLEARDTPGEEMRVHLEGRIDQRMPMEGPGPVWTLVPEQFISISEHDCPEPARLADLEITHWRLTMLESEGVQRVPDQREPHLVFREDERVAGSDGCNRIIGAYELEGASIAFSSLATTRMACVEGMNQASRFLQALEEVSAYRIIGQHLEMLDEAGELRLRFEAVAL